MSDSKKMRADDTKMLEDKTAAKADAVGATETHEDNLGVSSKKLKGAQDQLGVLHQDCDWLLSNADSRREARSDEVESLGKAKATLYVCPYSIFDEGLMLVLLSWSCSVYVKWQSHMSYWTKSHLLSRQTMCSILLWKSMIGCIWMNMGRMKAVLSGADA